MKTILQFIFSVGLTAIFGLLLYAGVVNFIPAKYSEDFFKLVPLYPKPKYAFLLYLIAGIIYFLTAREIFGEHMFSQVAILLLASTAVIASSQIIRLIAHYRKENVEETMEEEIERKRNQNF